MEQDFLDCKRQCNKGITAQYPDPQCARFRCRDMGKSPCIWYQQLAVDPTDACTDPDPWTSFPAWPWTCFITHGLARLPGLQALPRCCLLACPAPSMMSRWGRALQARRSPMALLALYLTLLLGHTNIYSPLWGPICHVQVMDPICDPLTTEHGVGDEKLFCAPMPFVHL